MIKLLMLGDSLVEWGDWGKLLPGVQVMNRGIAGEMTDELAVRLAEEMEDCPDTDAVLIESGTNNLLFGYLFFPAILSTICQRLRLAYPESPIIVCSLFPTPLAPAETIAGLNEELRQMSAETANCHFLDMVEPFFTQCLPVTHPGFLDDQVHLSTRGYQVWAEAIRQCLERLFP